jgi:hypothetical protein
MSLVVMPSRSGRLEDMPADHRVGEQFLVAGFVEENRQPVARVGQDDAASPFTVPDIFPPAGGSHARPAV